ncbi:MAG: threonine synthase [Clostridia bacterium]|nr:threonine synthase [Clostridia bacterium]
MKYVSTRDTEKNPLSVSSAEAIKRGLAPDKGLFMPTEIPTLTKDDLKALMNMPYEERAADILSRFLTDYDKDTLLLDCRSAYAEDRFPGGAAPLLDIGDGIYSLELWHGPTCAFKDMALQIMPRLLSRALTMTGEKRLAHILVATSGDTGKAALEGYRDVPGVKITVFYPVDGVSTMQKRQMTTQEGENVNVCAVRGNFDDAQNGVKAIFADASLAARAEENGFFFSSANSINWGRLAPQIVYYVSAYCDLVKNGTIALGDKANVCVPTGNFGNIFAAYIAREMGLPLGKLICASNANCVLTDFIRTGVYDRTRPFYKTMSPSMDILISSNLERLLYLLGGASLTADCMAQLAECGKYEAPADLMQKLRAVFAGYYCTEEETAKTIRASFEGRKYLCDTHTAVGLGAAQKYRAESGDTRPIILASTASPYKFPADVCASLGKPVDTDEPAEILDALKNAGGTEIPAPLARTLTLPVRFTKVVDAPDMPNVIFD